MGSTDKSLLWCGLAIFAWIVYQLITGKAVYKRQSAHREHDPSGFWLAIAIESLGGIACLGWGLECKSLAIISSAALELGALVVGFWVIGVAVRRAVKYRLEIFFALGNGRPQVAVRELLSFLVQKPGDRETLLLLADAYEQAGQQEEAQNIYQDLAQMEDRWGRSARKILRNQSVGRKKPTAV